jgi:hypothetical protein
LRAISNASLELHRAHCYYLHKPLVKMAVQPLRGGLVAVLSTLACGLGMPNVLCSPVDLKPWAVCSRSPVMITTSLKKRAHM